MGIIERSAEPALRQSRHDVGDDAQIFVGIGMADARREGPPLIESLRADHGPLLLARDRRDQELDAACGGGLILPAVNKAREAARRTNAPVTTHVPKVRARSPKRLSPPPFVPIQRFPR